MFNLGAFVDKTAMYITVIPTELANKDSTTDNGQTCLEVEMKILFSSNILLVILQLRIQVIKVTKADS